MGPPRRTAPTCDSYSSQYSLSDASTPPQSPTADRHHSQPSVPSQQPQRTNIGMSPASRYSHNLKVLRRRDPSIVSIFDQFSHVCLYHHNGNKWEKQGFEGSMFLYERESYPPYGFYILNRMGMYDHIQRLYPEDSIAAQGNYLIIRSYPEYTNRRLSIARTSPSNDVPHKFSDVYAIPNVDQLKPEDKGDAHTIGLWMFATDAKEHMIDVIQRLHSYIKQNKPYPEKFRFGPGGPPPPNVHSPTPRQLDIGFPTSQSSASNVSTYSHSRPGSRATRPSTSQPHINGNTSELDKLFAKLEPVPSGCGSSSKSPISNTTSNMSVETLFAALGGKELRTTSPLPTSATSTTSTGLPLLDSIFASAFTPASRPPTTQPPAIQPPTPTEHNISIYSPTPTTEPLPQILNQDVISTLLGLPPSRTASAASTAYSSGAVSHPSSREGDNEDEGYRRGGSDGYSESSTVLDPDAELDEELQSAGASAGRPIVAAEFEFQVTSNGHSHLNGTGQRIHGDVTPRPPMNGFITPRSNNLSRFHSASSLRTEPQTRHSVPGERELVPFETDSDLWPYPRAAAPAAESEQSDGEEIIELDFEDTSALSDMDTFTRVLKGKKHAKTVGGGVIRTNGSESERGRGRKKGKKEREADRIRIREEIESSWDVPGPSVRVQRAYEVEGIMPEPASPCPCPSPVPMRTPSPKITPPVAKPAVANHVNGVTPKRKEQVAKRKEELPQKKEEGSNGAAVHSDAVKGSLTAAVSAKMPAPKSMERNEFVREVLTLIHTDRAFVDTLWQEYKNRLR